MSTELPDFNSAPAWVDALGGVVTRGQLMGYRGPLSDFSAGAPWTPLDTADEWVQRIDREKAKIIGWVAYRCGGDLDDVVDAVLAALPELMGGESDD